MKHVGGRFFFVKRTPEDTHTIHGTGNGTVYINLHERLIYMGTVGKYTRHGCYGILCMCFKYVFVDKDLDGFPHESEYVPESKMLVMFLLMVQKSQTNHLPGMYKTYVNNGINYTPVN